jgi:hypothetical protein
MGFGKGKEDFGLLVPAQNDLRWHSFFVSKCEG